MTFVNIAQVSEIPIGKMKHVEVNGNEILVANVGGTFYAVSDRCGHMNARLSMGTLTGTDVTCPMHGSRFDVITGKKVADPVLQGLQGALLKLAQRQMELMKPIKTYDLRPFPIKVDGESILVDV